MGFLCDLFCSPIDCAAGPKTRENLGEEYVTLPLDWPNDLWQIKEGGAIPPYVFMT
jgi:hypothetical protein